MHARLIGRLRHRISDVRHRPQAPRTALAPSCLAARGAAAPRRALRVISLPSPPAQLHHAADPTELTSAVERAVATLRHLCDLEPQIDASATEIAAAAPPPPPPPHGAAPPAHRHTPLERIVSERSATLASESSQAAPGADAPASPLSASSSSSAAAPPRTAPLRPSRLKVSLPTAPSAEGAATAGEEEDDDEEDEHEARRLGRRNGGSDADGEDSPACGRAGGAGASGGAARSAGSCDQPHRRHTLGHVPRRSASRADATSARDADADADADAVAPTPTPSAKLAAGGLLQALCAQCRPATTRCVARLTPSAQPSHLSRHWLGYCGGASG